MTRNATMITRRSLNKGDTYYSGFILFSCLVNVEVSNGINIIYFLRWTLCCFDCLLALLLFAGTNERHVAVGHWYDADEKLVVPAWGFRINSFFLGIMMMS